MHPKDLYFRMDHQTFRKLPKTGGIIFGVCVILSIRIVHFDLIRFLFCVIYRHPIMKRLSDFEDDPLVPALLVKLHEEGDRVLMDVR